MFEVFPETPLFGANLITQQFKADPRSDKIDLGLGVYRDDAGLTPVMAAVKEAEARLLRDQTSKSYVGLAGDAGFCDALAALVLGQGPAIDDWTCVQTPGGVAALRLAIEMIAQANPSAKVWASSPSWANHGPIMRASGLEVVEFRFLDAATQTLDAAGMLADLETASRGDVVLLQACCHNPTGIEMPPAHWDQVAEVVARRSLLPILDVAYQGFGQGLEDDVYGVRAIAAQVPEAMMAVTCSKTFSNYRDRSGILGAMTRAADQLPRVRQKMLSCVNTLYAMPPDHGAVVVKLILTDEGLRAQWLAELDVMRDRVQTCRRQLAEALRQATNGDAFDFLTQHRGMFSLLPLSLEQVKRLRAEQGVYILPDGRMNLAGLTGDHIEQVARAIAKVMRDVPQ